MNLSPTTFVQGAKYTIWETVQKFGKRVVVCNTMEGETGKGFDVFLMDADSSIGLKLNYRPFRTIRDAKAEAENAYSVPVTRE